MANPDFHAQAGAPDTAVARGGWFYELAKEFRGKGATWVRYAIVDTPPFTSGPPEMLVIDGWKQRPDDEGEPSVDVTYAEAS